MKKHWIHKNVEFFFNKLQDFANGTKMSYAALVRIVLKVCDRAELANHELKSFNISF